MLIADADCIGIMSLTSARSRTSTPRSARRGERDREEVAAFEYDAEKNLRDLQPELVDGAYRHFSIRDPKRRKISAAPFRDRVVHHAADGAPGPGPS